MAIVVGLLILCIFCCVVILALWRPESPPRDYDQ